MVKKKKANKRYNERISQLWGRKKNTSKEKCKMGVIEKLETDLDESFEIIQEVNRL